MTETDDEFVKSMTEWAKTFPKQVCYEPVLRRDTYGFIVDARVEAGTATSDKSKVDCQECLEMIHA